MSGLADLVCHTDTERSSAPSATTEQILDVATGADGLRKKICGLYACDSKLEAVFECGVGVPLTATSTVFSCPTRLISEVQLFRAITAAMNTNPMLFVAFDAVMCAPSGDQL